MSRKLERGMIGRTVTLSHCEGQNVVNGAFARFTYDLFGDYTDPAKATNALRRRLDDQSITITNVTCDTDYYAIPISLFVKTALEFEGDSENE